MHVQSKTDLPGGQIQIAVTTTVTQTKQPHQIAFEHLDAMMAALEDEAALAAAMVEEEEEAADIDGAEETMDIAMFCK